MRRFSQRSPLVTLSEINITPLLDLAFVLLIIFVITTPLLEQSINLKLPRGGQPDKAAGQARHPHRRNLQHGLLRARPETDGAAADRLPSSRANSARIRIWWSISAPTRTAATTWWRSAGRLPEKRHHALFAAHRPDAQMNRLQKKCVIATAGIHLLLLLILLVGPAFFNPQPKPDDTQVLDVIPANLIDAAFNSGVRGAHTATARAGRHAAAAGPTTAAAAVQTPPPTRAEAG